MMDLNTAVGHTLRRIRQDNLWTLRDVSSKCYVSISHLSDIETSKTPVSLPMLEQVCTKGLGIEMTVLMKEIYDTLKENR
jgi:transcriptional regulator with XRE-family HTH domain